ncbi:MAG TPA: single-stranded-DNA-specific exonuclease RecJ, partial [Armatimonadetes bacterium]|nr:single-stranded-DNA-specific exonuclease RecJ [Armatimonadota bacterium]
AGEWAQKLGISAITAQVLLNRGLDTVEAAQQFLNPDLSLLSDPHLLPDLDRAVHCLLAAAQHREKVFIYTDYDVDGLTGGALLYRLLTSLGVEVGYFVPHRIEEGYGLHSSGIDAAVQEGAKVLISVDCGTTNEAEVAYARKHGLEVIIADHHEPGPERPEALAFINPKRPDSRYPFRDLCGAGVAFKLGCALTTALGYPWQTAARAFLDLVALGTICDLVPLLHENRFFAKEGLQYLATSRKIGLQALLEKTRLTGRESTSYHVGFVLGPRLNASGRLGTAKEAFELLITSDPHRAHELAQYLHQLNYERQQEEGRTVEEAQALVEEEKHLERGKALVLASRGWHLGVVGLVASRLVERYHRPTVVIAIGPDEARGSARSIPEFHLLNALRECGDVLLQCGGHEYAAGLSLEPDRIEEFRQRFNAVADQWLRPEDLRPKVEVDAVVRPPAVTLALAEELAGLGPFGQGNPPPVLACRDLRVVEASRMGPEGQHLCLQVRAGESQFRCLGWRRGMWADWLKPGEQVALSFTPEVDEWQGQRRLQLVIRDLKRRR